MWSIQARIHSANFFPLISGKIPRWKKEMSTWTFYPICWFEHAKWKSVQVIGRLDDGQSVYLRIGFRPYFTVQYPLDSRVEDLNERHEYLLAETPVVEVATEDENQKIYRLYLIDREDYYQTVSFFKDNIQAVILDEKQDIKSKFFAEKKLKPGSWQVASNLKTLRSNTRTGKSYTVCDLEAYTTGIVSVDRNAPIPDGVNAFLDIEAIPSDDLHFPDADAERPPDIIFAISLIVGLNNVIYILTNREIPSRYITSTRPRHEVTVVRCGTEKELLEEFFKGLAQVRPDRMITMNGRHFDMNYIGVRSKSLGVQIPPFTKIRDFVPFFREITIVQKKPFPSIDRVQALFTPGIQQIDLLDFYRRLLPHLGNHKLETIGKVVLGRGKTGLTIPELFARYRRAAPEDIAIIIDYSILDSILLRELWSSSQIGLRLAVWANFWKQEAEDVLVTEKEDLFKNLYNYYWLSAPEKYNIGRAPGVERKPGIHYNVYIYSLSDIYLTTLEQLGDRVAYFFTDYFKTTDDGIIPFKSGYFNVKFKQVEDFIRTQIPDDRIVWIEENSVAVLGNRPTNSEDLGPVPFFPLVYYIPLIVVEQKSWLLIDQSGTTFKKGTSAFVRPPFPLVDKYINTMIQSLLEHPGQPVNRPNIESTMEDLVLETKVSATDFTRIPKQKEAIIRQLNELGLPVLRTWRKVRYIQTLQGPVIEEIYSMSPEKYGQQIDIQFYNKKLDEILKRVFK